MPGKDFLIAEGKLRIPIGIGFLEFQRCLDGQIKIKLYHAIGKEIVVGNAAIFIRPLAEHEVSRAIRMNDAAAIPEAGSFDVNFHSLQVKILITGGIKVLLHSERNICGNVQLTGTNVPAFALLRTVERCHPRIPSAGIVHLFGVLFCLRKGSYAIFH